jgi:hypothetical protein
MVYKDVESFFLFLERNRLFDKEKFDKLSKRQKSQILQFIVYLNDKKKDIRYVNLILKFERTLKKKFISIHKMKKNYE